MAPGSPGSAIPVYRGLDGMKRWVGLSVLADNLINIGKVLAAARV